MTLSYSHNNRTLDDDWSYLSLLLFSPSSGYVISDLTSKLDYDMITCEIKSYDIEVLVSGAAVPRPWEKKKFA